MSTKTLNIWIAINEDGDFHVDSEDAINAVDGLRDNYNCQAVRTIELAVTVDAPQIETIPVTVPALSQAPAEVSVS